MLELSPYERRMVKRPQLAQIAAVCGAVVLEIIMVSFAISARSRIIEVSRPLHLTFREAINFQPAAGHLITEDEAMLIHLQPAFYLPALAGSIVLVMFVVIATIHLASRRLIAKLARRLQELGEIAPPNSA